MVNVSTLSNHRKSGVVNFSGIPWHQIGACSDVISLVCALHEQIKCHSGHSHAWQSMRSTSIARLLRPFQMQKMFVSQHWFRVEAAGGNILACDRSSTGYFYLFAMQLKDVSHGIPFKTKKICSSSVTKRRLFISSHFNRFFKTLLYFGLLKYTFRQGVSNHKQCLLA